jgi:hypothetical protein
MKTRYLLFLLLFISASCGDDRGDASMTSDSAVDAARNFVQAALVGDFDRARNFMVDDSLNNEDLNTVRRLNERLSKEEKDKYQEASIRIHQDRKVNDSTEIVYYSNSFKNKIDSLKVIRDKNEWKVDFKFMFHKNDSLP